jgi:hypothetical protein
MSVAHRRIYCGAVLPKSEKWLLLALWPDGGSISIGGAAMAPMIAVKREKVAEFCRRRHIRRLSLFGSVLRPDFRPDSDVDVLVEFQPGRVVGLIRLAGIERELSGVIGRKVDIRTAADLSRYFRDDVLAKAEVLYAEER